MLVIVGLVLDCAAAMVYFQLAPDTPTQADLRADPGLSINTVPPGTRPVLDAIAIFCAGVPASGGIDQRTVERLNHAARLYRSGISRLLIVVGCHWSANRADPDVMRRPLLDAGIPADQVIRDEHSHDTLSNCDELRGIIAERNLRNIALLSSPLHLMRIQHLCTDWNAHPDFRLELIPFRAGADRQWTHVYREIHHEWLALCMYMVLPESWFRSIMLTIRR